MLATNKYCIYYVYPVLFRNNTKLHFIYFHCFMISNLFLKLYHECAFVRDCRPKSDTIFTRFLYKFIVVTCSHYVLQDKNKSKAHYFYNVRICIHHLVC